MRILFMPFSAPSHYLPMVPLIWAFRAAGHQVCVVGQPMIESTVVSSGIPLVTITETYDVLAEGRRIRELPRKPDGDPMAGFRAMTEVHTEFARTVVADTVSFCRDWRPDLVVGDPLMLAAPIVAAHARAPLVKHLWGADTMRVFGCPGAGRPIDDWPDSLRDLYAEYGADPQPETGVASIDPCPPSLRICETPSRVPVRYIPYNGTNVIPPGLMNPPKKGRVLVTKGTMPVRQEGIGSFPIAGVVNDLEDFDLEVVLAVTSRDRESTRDLPATVRVVEQVPIDTILPTCDAVVHHGGSGTLLTAAHHGVPQVAITATPDEMAACAPMAAIGAGIQVPVSSATPDRIKSAISEVLTNEEIRSAADGLRSEIAALPVPSEVVARLCLLATS
jgi:UDP:flavonoid glycosyltransferase YjiC (YdhE family)